MHLAWLPVQQELLTLAPSPPKPEVYPLYLAYVRTHMHKLIHKFLPHNAGPPSHTYTELEAPGHQRRAGTPRGRAGGRGCPGTSATRTCAPAAGPPASRGRMACAHHPQPLLYFSPWLAPAHPHQILQLGAPCDAFRVMARVMALCHNALAELIAECERQAWWTLEAEACGSESAPAERYRMERIMLSNAMTARAVQRMH